MVTVVIPPKLEIEICNSALIKIGASRITAFDDGSDEAAACVEHYVRSRDSLERRHVWNFTVARYKMARLTEDPVYEWRYRYQLPSDWLRTVAVYDNEAAQGYPPYRIEGRQIVSEKEQLWLRYQARVTDPSNMTATFKELLALYLARDLALPLAKSNQIRNTMEARFRKQLRRAVSSDAIEDFADDFPESSWVASRNADLSWPYRP